MNLKKKIIFISVGVILIFFTIYLISLIIIEEIRQLSGYAEVYQRIYDECCPELPEGYICLVDYYPMNYFFVFLTPLMIFMWGVFIIFWGKSS